mmetsp:Transcript_5970/g.8689  ORF Transcript_5970/g.8689 Transcript_5970/m.8689 type:complete len:153 (+) Transcript_5970:502-960(+)
MTRLKLDWLGQDAPSDDWKKTYKIVAAITVVYVVLSMLLSPPSGTLIETDEGFNYEEPPTNAGTVLYNILNVIYGAYCLYIMYKVRVLVRSRDQIPERHCNRCEDFCCAFFCGICTASQVARQTVDYDTQEAAFCTADGLQRTTQAETVLIV